MPSRLTVGQQILDLLIGVRIPARQPNNNPAEAGLLLGSSLVRAKPRISTSSTEGAREMRPDTKVSGPPCSALLTPSHRFLYTVLMYYTYILRTSGNTLYVGYTKDLQRRVRQHRTRKGGAAYLRIFSDCHVVYVETFDTQHDAMSRERHLKLLSHAGKEEVVEENTDRSRDILIRLKM